MQEPSRLNKLINKITPGFVKKSLLSIPQNWSTYYFGTLNSNTNSGVSINQYNAETVTALYNCLRVRAETRATIKTMVMRYEGDTKTRAITHPVDYLVSMKSNNEVNAYNFWFTMSWLEDVWGNFYAYIEKDASSVPRQLHILEPWEVEVRRDKEDGSIWYKYGDKIYPSRNILHTKQNSLDGIIGRSIISINREKIGLAKKQENYAANSVGEKPYGIFTSDEATLSEEQMMKIAKNFKEHVKKGLIPFLSHGSKFQNMMMPAGDIELFNMMNITKQDIYSMFRIPSNKSGDYSREAGGTYNNVEQQNINFVQDVVMPMISQVENECNCKLFTRSAAQRFRVEFDLSDLLRADLKTEKEFFESMLTRGVMSRNEVRQRKGLNPINPEVDPNGDRYFIQAGFIPADRVDDFLDQGKPSEPKHLNGHAKRTKAGISEN